MIKTVLLFIPGMTCLFWLALNLMVRIKDKEFKTLDFFLAITGIALFAEAGLTCTDGTVLLSLFIVKQFFALLIIPVAFAYIRSLSSAGNIKSLFQAVIAISFSLLVAQIILIMLEGDECFIDCIMNPAAHKGDEAAKIIRICSFWIFHAILTFETIAFITFSVISYSKGNHHIQLVNTTVSILVFAVLEMSVAFTFPLWIQNTVSVILTCLMFYLSYSGMFKGEMNPIPCVNAGQTPASAPEKTADAGIRQADARQSHTDVHQSLADAHHSIADEDSLRIRFEDLIVSEQLFLKQGIRLSDIAAKLDTNRTYISRLVNNTYNMSFSDYINTLRIDYAEQYLLHNRNAKQSDIAAACGFPDASAFNNVFKKITGVTPKIWLATKS